MAVTADDLMAHFEDDHYVDITQIDGDTPLFSSGLVNSFAMIDTMEFVEKALGRRMNPSDFTVANMDTVNKIMAYIASQTA